MKKTILSILTLSIFNVISITLNNPVSALTYSEDIDVNFTFNTSLTVSLSSPDIIINDLTPGTSSDSNIVDINVNTNNITGYYLTSTVGSSSNATTNLLNSNNTNTFTSLATNDSIVDLSTYDTSSLANPNVWGYSYSVDNQSTWSAYSGLPIYTSAGTTLSDKYVPSDDTINFKIGAKANTHQVAGTYTNTINFITTAYPSPMNLADSYAYFNKSQIDGYYTMQDMEPGICTLAEEGSELQVMDIRDQNIYWIAKLKDDNCWMTQNLDLNLGTAPANESALDETNTNIRHLDAIPETGTYSVVSGYSNINGVTTWAPNATIDATNSTGAPESISGWEGGHYNARSVDPGDWYYSGTWFSSFLCGDGSNGDGATCDYISKSNSMYASYFSTSPYSENGTHGHIGNYYDWSAAIASNDSSDLSSSTYDNPADSPQNSICPSGWRLPIVTSYEDGALGGNEFYNLVYYYNEGVLNSTDVALTSSPLYFTRSGRIWGTTVHFAGYCGYYWSNTVNNDTKGYDFYVQTNGISPNNAGGQRWNGRSVRCLAR